MSIISRMRELESYDDASLVNMIQEGNSRYPQYAVLGEIERRKDLRRITENQIAMQNQPTMSVADESVMQFAQGNQPVAGLQGAQPTMMQEGGSTALEQSFMPPFLQDRYFDEEGEFQLRQLGSDLGKGALVAASFNPYGLTSRAALGGLSLLKQTPALFNQAGRQNILKGLGRFGARIAPSMQRGPGGQFLSQANIGKNILKTGARIAAPVAVASALFGESETPAPSPAPSPAPRELTETEKELQGLQLIQSKSKMEEMQKAKDDDKALDLISLGGLVLSSRNLAELGANIANFAESKRGRKGTALEQTQASYYEAQVAKIMQELADAPARQINDTYKTLSDYYETLQESGGKETEMIGVSTILDGLNRQLAQMRGIDLSATGLPAGASIQ